VAGAFVVEGLTKVINLVGVLNPGNLGTYEGGNMLIARVLGVPATTGLTLALCRRARSIFWAGIGITLSSAPVAGRRIVECQQIGECCRVGFRLLSYGNLEGAGAADLILPAPCRFSLR